MNEEQDVVGGEISPGKHFDGEEVGTCQDGHGRGNEILPGSILAPLVCRLDPLAMQDVAHRLIGDGVAKIGQGSDDAVVSPAGGALDDISILLGTRLTVPSGCQ